MPEKPAEYRLTPEAERDIEGIWLYTLDEWGFAQPNRYTDTLLEPFGQHAERYFPYFSRVTGHRHLDVEEILGRSANEAVFYVCGPVALIEAVRAGANRLGIATERLEHGSFS